MLPESLQIRKTELQRALQKLSGGTEIINADVKQTSAGEVVITFVHSVRIKRAGLRMRLCEEFRDTETASGSLPERQRLRLPKRFRNIGTDPDLYAFAYHIGQEADVQCENPLFRYECHPDVGDKPLAGEEDQVSVFQSPYQHYPHFHPDDISLAVVRKLHFPFHREERKRVAFSLIEWLQVDLLKRFYANS